MKIGNIEKITEKYKRMVFGIEANANIQNTSHFQHIARNLLNIMGLNEELIKSGTLVWKNTRHNYFSSMMALKTYLKTARNLSALADR